MRTTIDKAGRLVVPKVLRDRVGMTGGEVEIHVSGGGLLVTPVATDDLISEDGLLLLPAGGQSRSTDDIRELRLGDQR
ncbi:MAG TPA: AbrB/MazE/SpoVT family DNA-binding domain-containing protein [Nakamurella sp.]|jgi:AbrB family looped-hinge helix DNA binding protein